MPTLAVLDTIAAAMSAGDRVWGLRICQSTGLGSGTVYPILERLEDAGWIMAEWEQLQPCSRPRRRFYELTNAGRNELAEARLKRAARYRRLGFSETHIGWSAQ